MSGNMSEPKRQSKFSDIDCSIRNTEAACTSLEDVLDILQGSPEPVAGKADQSEKCFVAVYDDISARVRKIEERIRLVIDRLQEMLI